MPRVAVVGAVNADYIVRVDRLPQPGETVTGGRLSIRPGGKGANQAHAAARLGADVLLVASVGTDGAADDERAALVADGVDTGGLTARVGPTGLAVVLVDATGENAIAVAGAANDELDPTTVTERLGGWLDTGSVLLCSLEIPLAAAVAAARAAAAAGALPVINPAPARPLPPELVRGAILTPNEGELVRMAPGAEGELGRMAPGAEGELGRMAPGVEGELGRMAPRAGGEQAAVSRLLDCGAHAVVVTRGRRGASVFTAAQPPVTIGAPPVDVVDTVGAGDAFNGALAWSLACGAPLPAAVTAAAAAGAAACTGTGARDALPTPAALAALIGQPALTAACPPPEGGRHEH